MGYKKRGGQYWGGLLSRPPLGVTSLDEVPSTLVKMGSIYSSAPSTYYSRIGPWVINSSTLLGSVYTSVKLAFHVISLNPTAGCKKQVEQA